MDYTRTNHACSVLGNNLGWFVFPHVSTSNVHIAIWHAWKFCFTFELDVERYRIEEEVKAKFVYMRSKVKNFIKIYHKIDNELMDEHEQVILQLAMMEYKHKNNGVDFPYKDAWDILKDVSYF